VTVLTIRGRDEHGACGDKETLIACNRLPDDVPGCNPTSVNMAGTAPGHDGGGGGDLKRLLLGIAWLPISALGEWPHPSDGKAAWDVRGREANICPLG
jgi:hypothetical protein